MGVHITTTTNFGPNLLQDSILARRFIERLESDLVTHQLADEENMAKSTGKTIQWNLWANATANTTALTEGADPAGQDLTTTLITGILQQFGDFFDIGDFFLEVAHSATMEEFVDEAEYAAFLTMDTLALTELDTTTSTQDAGLALKAEDLRTARGTLKGNAAKPHPKTPGGRFFCLVASTEAANDLMGEGSPVWHQIKDNNLADALQTPFVGTPATAAIYGFIVKESQNIQRETTTSPDDDHNFAIAGNSFGAVSLNNVDLMNPEIIITSAKQRVDSPLRMHGTVGWKINHDVELFDSNRVIEIASDATGVG